jgi:hypothetical protein
MRSYRSDPYIFPYCVVQSRDWLKYNKWSPQTKGFERDNTWRIYGHSSTSEYTAIIIRLLKSLAAHSRSADNSLDLEIGEYSSS